MTGPPVAPGPGGRRANGLHAQDWGALVDLDPRLSEGLLDRLAGAGVAAYVEPATAVDTVSRAVVMPGRPLDRLWVDATRGDAAREVVSSEVADLTALLAEDEPGATPHDLVLPVPRTAARRVLAPPALPDPPRPAAATPGPERPAPDHTEGGPAPDAPLDDDALFAQIVAGFADEPPGDGSRRWPEAEDLPPEGRRRRGDDPAGQAPARGAGPEQDRPPTPGSRALPPADPPARPRPQPAGPRDWSEPTGPGPAGSTDDGHYVPPPPPPVPRVRLRTLAALLSVLLGLAVLFAPQLLGVSTADPAVAVLGLVLLGGGAGALVWWVRDSAPDSGPDDGAVV